MTNFQKSSVATIRCQNVNLKDVLQSFPTVRATFPMRYLGLSLSMRQLKRADFQFLEDKIVAKLTTWTGRHLTATGRTTLVKSHLPSDLPPNASRCPCRGQKGHRQVKVRVLVGGFLLGLRGKVQSQLGNCL